MRLFLYSIYTILIVGCANRSENNTPDLILPDTKKNNKIIEQVCNMDYDSLLNKFSKYFKATSIGLNKSLQSELDSFLVRIDTICLRKQKSYKPFIVMILAKLYYYHLKCCNQGYDLQSMEQGGAKVIITEFKKMAGYQNKHIEMLNSGFVMDFIDHSQTLKDNSTLLALIIKINNEEKRIEKGL